MKCFHLRIRKVRGNAKVRVVKSGKTKYDCINENFFAWHPTSDFHVLLSKTGSKFGDCIFDDHGKEFHFVSERVLKVLSEYQPDLVYYNVNIDEPIPAQYKDLSHEEYFVLDYRKLNVVNYNLQKHPYIDPWICPECHVTREGSERIFKYDSNGGETFTYSIDLNEILKYLINNTEEQEKPRPFNFADYKGDHLFRIECSGLACTETLKNELQKRFKGAFEFEEVLFG